MYQQYFIFSVFLNRKKAQFHSGKIKEKKSHFVFLSVQLRKEAHFLHHKGILMNTKSIFHIAE